MASARVTCLPPASSRRSSSGSCTFFRVLHAGGLPPPERQHPLPALSLDGRVDAAYPQARLIVEVDGRRWHTQVEDFERDRRRDIEAGLRGWRVVRFVCADLTRSPDWVCQVVSHHVAVAAAG